MTLFLIGNGFAGKAHYQRRYHIAGEGGGGGVCCGRPVANSTESGLLPVRRIDRTGGGTVLLAGPKDVVVCLECAKVYDAANTAKSGDEEATR